MVATRRAANGRAAADNTKSELLFQTRYRNPLNRDKLRENVIRPALRTPASPRASAPTTFVTRTLR